MSEGAVVGIDLGTTYSVCAIVENGKPRVISDTGGSYTIPSIVAVDEKGNRLVGQAAKRQSEINPINTVFGSKRLVGRDIHSNIIDEIEKHVRYKIEEGESDDVSIRLRKDSYALEEIQAMILDHIRNTAQDMLGQEITQAVVTVPAYFNDRQRQAVREAGRIAQLEVLRIINEPTAAALAYGYGKGLKQRVAIFDLGGGTFDVSILELRDNVFEVKATGGNTFLGGVDFDNKLVEHVVAEFEKAHGVNLAKDPMSHQRLKDACERAKIDLSTRSEARLHIPYIAMGPEGPLNLDVTVTRDQFEAMLGPLIDHTLEVTRHVIDDSGWTSDQIDSVLLVGGSTRVPLVARRVEEFFGKQPSKNVHPDEAVALGAAVMADSIVNHQSDIQLLDVLPIGIGIGLPSGKVLHVFKRNTPVPNQKMKVFTTSRDNQDSLKIKVVQGDTDQVAKSEIIGDFVFRGIHPAAKGQAKVEVIFTINMEGILQVTARDPDTGVEQSGTLQVSSTMQKTFKKDLIQPKKPAPKKEVQKVIGSTVTREKKISAPTPPPKAAPKQAAGAATPPAKKVPSLNFEDSAGDLSFNVPPASAQAKTSAPATPPPPDLSKKGPEKPGFFKRIWQALRKPIGKGKK